METNPPKKPDETSPPMMTSSSLLFSDFLSSSTLQPTNTTVSHENPPTPHFTPPPVFATPPSVSPLLPTAVLPVKGRTSSDLLFSDVPPSKKPRIETPGAPPAFSAPPSFSAPPLFTAPPVFSAPPIILPPPKAPTVLNLATPTLAPIQLPTKKTEPIQKRQKKRISCVNKQPLKLKMQEIVLKNKLNLDSKAVEYLAFALQERIRQISESLVEISNDRFDVNKNHFDSRKSSNPGAYFKETYFKPLTTQQPKVMTKPIEPKNIPTEQEIRNFMKLKSIKRQGEKIDKNEYSMLKDKVIQYYKHKEEEQQYAHWKKETQQDDFEMQIQEKSITREDFMLFLNRDIYFRKKEMVFATALGLPYYLVPPR